MHTHFRVHGNSGDGCSAQGRSEEGTGLASCPSQGSGLAHDGDHPSVCGSGGCLLWLGCLSKGRVTRIDS